MKIPPDAIIPEPKIKQYLLVFKEKNDKSKYLARAGFTAAHPEALEREIRRIIHENDAVYEMTDRYGAHYLVTGTLIGSNGVELAVTLVWLRRAADREFQFITLKPGG